MRYVSMDAENIPYCVAVAKELHGLGTFGRNGPEFDWDFCTAQFIDVCRSDAYFHRFAVDDGGIFVGGLIGHVTPFMFSPRLMALEDAWYVRAGVENRTKAAIVMMRAFIHWAMDEMNCVLVQTGDIAAIDSVAVDNIYRHLGFKRFGTVFKYAREA
jgi:hypothetical protein